MADDQGQKTTSIDDLVNELTKKDSSVAPSVSKPTSPISGSSPSTGESKPPSLRTTSPAPASQSEMSKPKFTPPPSSTSPVSKPPTPPITSQAKPTSPPAGGSAPPSGLSSIKEYQSSIRTMKDDISTLKQGEKPAGINIPRKVEIPPPPTGGSAAPTTPKPITPPSPGQFKVPSVNLGQTEKTGPLPQAKIPTPPSADRPLPSKPAPPPSAPSGGGEPQKSPIYAPPPSAGGISSGRNRLFIIIAGVAVIFAGLYWFLIIRPQTLQVAEETPIPTPTATPIVSLSSIFQGITNVAISFENNTDGTPIVADLNTRIDKAVIIGGEFQNLSEPPIITLLSTFLDAEGINYPRGLVDLQLSEFLPLLYGQIESFDSAGQIKTGTGSEKRLVLINEAANSLTASQTMKDWELTLSADLKSLFGLGQSKENEFLDNVYREVNIRYKNFPYADRSIDYAIVSALNGKNYLVITNSREAMFSAIDELKGF